MDHWDALRKAIYVRGMKNLVAANGTIALMNLVSEAKDGSDKSNYDPLMHAYWSIVGNLSDIDAGILLLDGCPLCYANRMHDEQCKEDNCGYKNLYDEWVQFAANDEVQIVKKHELHVECIHCGTKGPIGEDHTCSCPKSDAECDEHKVVLEHA
jgi:hypothetical protein